MYVFVNEFLCARLCKHVFACVRMLVSVCARVCVLRGGGGGGGRHICVSYM